MMKEHQVISGWRGAPSFFRFGEYTSINAEAALEVVNGSLAGAIFRKVIDTELCSEICERFTQSFALRRRSKEAPGSYVGALHWLKPLDILMSEVPIAVDAIKEIVPENCDPIAALDSKILSIDGGPIRRIRPAEYHGTSVCPRLIRAWHGEAVFALEPHEDESQLGWAGQADFEVSQIRGYPVCAINACLENTAGGELYIWNIRPDSATKRSLEVQDSGIPYPLAALSEFDCSILQIEKGDLYIFNGRLVHAVGARRSREDKRATLSCLAGRNDHHEIIQWT